ncbi:MAG: M20/M25/M40 family metallo-hydrolase [Synergistaceae bacterium]|nr:M20/M25/M40 family metallo-hydrolase [Synergistaceae bacterium]
MGSVTDHFANEDMYPELDVDGAARRLARGVRCRTVGPLAREEMDFSEFDRLHDVIKESYPRVVERGGFEPIEPTVDGRRVPGRSVLIELPGTDPALRPALFMAHQDVVPVVAGTEGEWTHGAFSGDVADGYVWGRGTLDDKHMLFGILEAAEHLLAQGRTFRRTTYLAFGDDEETFNLGAGAIAETLEARGVRLEMVLDEGGSPIEDGAKFGAPGTWIASIDLMEKGYADVELSVESEGGHSSQPFGGTSLGILARAIADIAGHPMPTRLPSALRATFERLAPHITEAPFASLVRDLDANAQAIAEQCLARPETFVYVTTTIAPTMIEGGSAACNVLPQDMRATINFRIAEGDSVEDVMAHCRAHVGSERVCVRALQANGPSSTARTDGYGWAKLTESMRTFYPGVTFVPSMSVGATDARRYERVCDTCLRRTPSMADAEDARRGVHGTDERILIRAYAQGIRALIHLMEHVSVDP